MDLFSLNSSGLPPILNADTNADDALSLTSEFFNTNNVSLFPPQTPVSVPPQQPQQIVDSGDRPAVVNSLLNRLRDFSAMLSQNSSSVEDELQNRSSPSSGSNYYYPPVQAAAQPPPPPAVPEHNSIREQRALDLIASLQALQSNPLASQQNGNSSSAGDSVMTGFPDPNMENLANNRLLQLQTLSCSSQGGCFLPPYDPNQSRHSKRKREAGGSMSDDEASIHSLTVAKKAARDSVIHGKVEEIRHLLNLQSSTMDDGVVLNIVIKYLKEEMMAKRSMNVAMNAAPTFWKGFDYNGDVLEDARTTTMLSVGKHGENFANSTDYHSVFEMSPFAMAICGLDGRFVDCNPQFEEMTGYKKSMITQTTLFATMDAQEVPQFLSCVEPLINGKMRVYMKQRKCVHADGEVYMAQCFISVVRDQKSKKPIYFSCLGLPMFDQHP